MKLLVPLLALALLAGCLGYPPEAARPGDTVQVHYVARDAATGATVSTGNATVVVGGPSGLGTAVGRALVGHRANDTLGVEARGDPGLAFTDTISLGREVGRRPTTEDVQVAVFRQVIGEPRVGMTFPYPRSVYVAEVTAVDNATVSLLLHLPTDPTTPYPQFGVAKVASIEGSEIVERLQPMADRPAFDGSLAGLPVAGTYRARGVEGNNITFDHSPVTDPALVGHDVDFDVTVVSVGHGTLVTTVSGEFGHRLSPLAR